LHFDDEAWVLGEGNKEKILDKPAMQRELRDQYTKEYIAQWRAVLKTSNVNRYNGLPDAASKLTTLSSPSAPLLRLFWWTSQNTCVDLPGMKEKFQAPQAVVPCSSTQFLIVDSNRSYNSSLQALQQAVDRAASDQSTNKEDALRGMHDSAGVAKLAAQSLGSSFMPDQEAQIDHRSLDLLLQPINYVDGIGGPSKPSGATFCAAFEKATRNKFPFEPLAREEAKLEDIDGLFLPKSGKLWVYYESSLKSVLQCTPGGECAPAGGTHLDPKFALSIGRLMKFSRALYGESGTEPNYHYTLRPQQSDQVEQFEIAINGDTQKLKGGAQHPYIWPGAGTRSFKLSLKLAGGTDTQVETWDGLWAVFHFFADADKTAPTGSAYTFGWGFRQGRGAQAVSVLGRQLTYEFAVDAGGGPIVFSKDFLSTLKCVVPPSR
jgi:type VI secretion system protein ImpL